MKLKIKIDSDNEANKRHDVVAMVRDIAARIEDDNDSGVVRDVNGNVVGKWSLSLGNDDDE